MAAAPNLRFVDLHPRPTDIRREVVEGLRHNPKTLPPKLFYDDRGSELFEEITRLPEYYLTRTEISILQRHADEMVELLGVRPFLIEFGSGSSRKVRILLDRLRGPAIYVPIDISPEALQSAAQQLAADYPDVSVIAVCADYTQPLQLPTADGKYQQTVFFPGSNLGNLSGPEARAFFAKTAKMLQPGDGMLLGLDRKKDPAVLNAAYNDSRGVTAEFNRNILQRINDVLDADFDIAQFEHLAFYNAEEGRIEMHLRSIAAQTVNVAGESFRFAAGELIHTENSYKYHDEDLARLIDGSGFEMVEGWSDERQWFSVYYLRVVGPLY